MLRGASTNNDSNSGSMAGMTGVALLNSRLLLSQLLDEINLQLQKQNSNSLLFDGKMIIELGCGTGFTTIAASKLGAKYVFATDGNMESR